jgi:hypothetical protein
MSILETYGKEIVSLLVPLVTWALNIYFKAKAKLFLASPHTFTFLVQQPLLDPQGNQISPTQTVHTRSHIINNSGKETATNVELVFNWMPPCINVWPSRHFDHHTEPDNRYVMIFPSLAPNEFLGCELLSINFNLPDLITVRSDQCVAQTITMFPQPAVKNWQRRVATALILAGLALVVYVTIILLQVLVLKTPLGH